MPTARLRLARLQKKFRSTQICAAAMLCETTGTDSTTYFRKYRLLTLNLTILLNVVLWGHCILRPYPAAIRVSEPCTAVQMRCPQGCRGV